MRIAICGCGVVGKATGEGFARLGHEVYTYDINPEASRVDWAQQLLQPESPPDCEFVFFCTPEEVAPDAVKGWSGHGLRVVRSSTLPGTVEQMEAELAIPIVHNPEFLREATALQDFLNPSYILIGANPRAYPALLEHLYRPFQAAIVITDPTTSEIVKMATNGLLATLIAYWNDLAQLCQALGVNSHEVGMITSLDPRVPAYGARMHHRYGGHCLPKDIHHLLTLARKFKLDAPVLAGVERWSA